MVFETWFARCSPIQISVTLEKVLEPLVKVVCNHCQESSDNHPLPDSLSFLNFFWVLQTLFMAIWIWHLRYQSKILVCIPFLYLVIFVMLIMQYRLQFWQRQRNTNMCDINIRSKIKCELCCSKT